MPLSILYEDNHLIAVYKKASDIVQGDKTGDTPLQDMVAAYLKETYKKPGQAFVGVIHRIDRPVSGIVLFAKTSKGLSRMNELFRQKQVKKTYLAIVCNKPPENSGTLKHFMIRNAKLNKSTAYLQEKAHAKEAVLHYTLLQSFDRYFLLQVEPVSGRHHQIRAQLSAIQCPIKGDLKYGAPRSNPDASIHLHAYKLSFTHPVSKEPVCIVAHPPSTDSLWAAVQV